METYSEHPIGQAIVEAAAESRSGVEPLHAIDCSAIAGQGIVGTVGEQTVIVGKRDWVGERVNAMPSVLQQECDRLEQQGQTVVWVAADDKVLGMIGVADTVHPDAAQLIQRLKQLGIEQIVMLTGDNERTANSIAQLVGVDRVYASLLPEEKVQIIQHLQQRFKSIAMVGDGINDAPALAQASVGIAMGGAGTDVALETADIVLMADRLEKLAQAIELGRRAQRIVKQNVGFALVVIGLLLIANFSAGITLPLGVIGHEGSTVLVTLNGLRLLKAG